MKKVLGCRLEIWMEWALQFPMTLGFDGCKRHHIHRSYAANKFDKVSASLFFSFCYGYINIVA